MLEAGCKSRSGFQRRLPTQDTAFPSYHDLFIRLLLNRQRTWELSISSEVTTGADCSPSKRLRCFGGDLDPRQEP